MMCLLRSLDFLRIKLLMNLKYFDALLMNGFLCAARLDGKKEKLADWGNEIGNQ